MKISIFTYEIYRLFSVQISRRYVGSIVSIDERDEYRVRDAILSAIGVIVIGRDSE